MNYAMLHLVNLMPELSSINRHTLLLVNPYENDPNQIIELNNENCKSGFDSRSLGLLQTDQNSNDKKSLVDLGFKDGSVIVIVHNQNLRNQSRSEQIKSRQQMYTEIGRVFSIDGLHIFQLQNQHLADVLYDEQRERD